MELAALVAKMMARKPEQRFQKPKDVAQALTPLFKKGNVAIGGAKPDLCQVGQAEVKQGGTSAVSASTWSAIEIEPAPAPMAR